MSKRKRGTAVEDVIRLRGAIEVCLMNAETGVVVERYANHNVVVTAGRAWVLNRLKSESPAAETLTHVAVGTSTTAPATGDTTLTSENTRKAIGTMSYGTASNPPWIQAQVSFATNEANTTLGEAGLFNSSAAGTMLSHVTFSTINKTTSNTLAISYTISN